jgi:pyrimidine operon attenuation protein / uracil phosphoribosyltransferase
MSEGLDAEAIYRDLLKSVAQRLSAAHRMPAIVGIYSGGAWVAERLHRDLGSSAPLGYLSSAFHRDDYAARGLRTGASKGTQIGFAVDGADILLVDDILYTGRTVRAAINEIYDYGRPRRIELAAPRSRRPRAAGAARLRRRGAAARGAAAIRARAHRRRPLHARDRAGVSRERPNPTPAITDPATRPERCAIRS